jgi:hypothetical protein
MGCGWLVCIKLSLYNRRHLLGLLYLRRNTKIQNSKSKQKAKVSIWLHCIRCRLRLGVGVKMALRVLDLPEAFRSEWN